ncbi:MAG: hypothetical protein L6Q83_09050 [Gammaproteobacteria bacterium]|nr:hypothetical protein [Gammaproteobacteria bacterium]
MRLLLDRQVFLWWLADPRRLAGREHTTLKALVEQGLRQVLAERRSGHGSLPAQGDVQR